MSPKHAEEKEFDKAPRGDSTEPDPFPGEGDPVATGAKGGGEWPDPDTPAQPPAPGSVSGARRRRRFLRRGRGGGA